MNPPPRIRVSLSLAGETSPRRVDADRGATYADVLRSQGVNPQAVLLLVGGRPLPMDAPAADGETLDVLPVFSGG